MDPRPSSVRSLFKQLLDTFPGESDLGTQSRLEMGPRHLYFEKPPGDSHAQLDLGTTVGNVQKTQSQDIVPVDTVMA